MSTKPASSAATEFITPAQRRTARRFPGWIGSSWIFDGRKVTEFGKEQKTCKLLLQPYTDPVLVRYVRAIYLDRAADANASPRSKHPGWRRREFVIDAREESAEELAEGQGEFRAALASMLAEMEAGRRRLLYMRVIHLERDEDRRRRAGI